MPRNMSFALTTDQILNRSKTVTRRFAWWNLQPGTILNAVEKGMGLKKGEQINRLAMIRVVSVHKEPLNAITQEDCIKEGFPDLSPEAFVSMLQEHNVKPVLPHTPVNRIEFEYVNGH